MSLEMNRDRKKRMESMGKALIKYAKYKNDEVENANVDPDKGKVSTTLNTGALVLRDHINKYAAIID